MATHKQTVSSRRGLLFAGGLFIPVVTSLLVGAGSEETSLLSSNRLEIERMTPAERAQLKRNSEAFQQMPLAEQQRYRELHRQLQTDDDAVTLRVTLDRYRNWLKMLSPFDREELRAIEDLDQRIERVKQLIAKQSTPDTLSDDDPRLSRADLAAMMNVIADKLEIPATEFEGKTEWERHMSILNALVYSRRNQIRPNDWTSVFEDQLINEMTAALPAGDFRTAISSVRFKPVRRTIVAHNVLVLLGRETADELAKLRPTLESMRLSPEERNQYEEIETQAEKYRFLLVRARMKRLHEVMSPYPSLQRAFFQLLLPRREGPPGRRYPGRGGRGFGPGGPEMQRRPPERNGPPPGPGFRPRDKRKRFDPRRPPKQPGD